MLSMAEVETLVILVGKSILWNEL